MFIFVELSRFVGEQIRFEVLVSAQLDQTLSQVNVLFLCFGFPNFLLVLESPDFKISKSFRHFCVTRATTLFGDFELP